METIDEKIYGLKELKKKWNDKYTELLEHMKSYIGGNDAEYIAEFQKKLDAISDVLKAIGKEYHQEVEKVADDITKNYKDNPIIQKMVEGVKSDIDDNWNFYHGDREARLKDLADVVDMFDKLQKI